MLLEDNVEISAAHASEVIAQIEARRNIFTKLSEPVALAIDNAYRQTNLDRMANRDVRSRQTK